MMIMIGGIGVVGFTKSDLFGGIMENALNTVTPFLRSMMVLRHLTLIISFCLAHSGPSR